METLKTIKITEEAHTALSTYKAISKNSTLSDSILEMVGNRFTGMDKVLANTTMAIKLREAKEGITS